MKNSYFFMFSILVLLLSCNKTKTIEKKQFKFIRVWFDTVQMMPFMSRLEIKPNNTFEYHGGACEARFGCHGTWKIENDTIILQSIKPKGCHFQNRFDFCADLDDKRFFETNKTIKDCEPTGGNTEYEIFENEKFIFRNDTLIHIKKIKDLCPKRQMAFSMLEKIRPNNR